MEQRYRKDYTGEFVISVSTWSEVMKNQQRQWMANPLENQQISNRAAVIGSRIDAEMFDHTILPRHKGGLLANKALQTYGCHNLWRDMRFDFFVTKLQSELADILAANYTGKTAVHTNSTNCLNWPGSFYLTPYTSSMDEMALAVYLAAFDGHEEVFMLGYNNDTENLTNHWLDDVNTVMATYTSTNFIIVTNNPANIPDMWRNNTNVTTMSHREFINYCDI